MECDVSPEKEGGGSGEKTTENPVEEEKILEFTITDITEVSEKTEEKQKPEQLIVQHQEIVEDAPCPAEVSAPVQEEVVPQQQKEKTPPPPPVIPEHSLRRSTIQRSVASEAAAKEVILLDDSPAKTVKHHHSLRRTVPRIIIKPTTTRKKQPQAPDPPSSAATSSTASTMREVLASIPGFSHVKPRRRTKKMSTAAQLEQTREGCIDLETPDSILVGTNLRALLNKQTFSILPPLYQYKLIQLLPAVDRPDFEGEPSTSTGGLRLNSSSLNNEFFARACLEWRERLAEGEFTPENQMKLKSEAERDKLKLDPWKLKHFEPMWGDKSGGGGGVKKEEPSVLTTAILQQLEPEKKPIDEVKIEPPPVEAPRRIRTVGAVTRSTTGSLQHQQNSPSKISSPVPDLLPIRTKATRPKEPPPPPQVTVISPKTTTTTTGAAAAESEDTREYTHVLKRTSPVGAQDERPGKVLKSEDVTDQPQPRENIIIPPIKEEEDLLEAASQETTQDAPETALQVALETVPEDIVLPEEILESQEDTKMPTKPPNLQEHDYVDIGSVTMLVMKEETVERVDPPLVSDADHDEILEDFVGDTEIVEQQVTLSEMPGEEEEDIAAVTCGGGDQEEEVEEKTPGQGFTFEGVLEIQPSTLLLEADTLPCLGDDESQSSASALADCSGDNSVDPAAVEELEPTIQNIPIDVVDHENIEQNFTDAENYVLESGEIVAEDEGSGQLSLGTKICSGEDIQADLFAAAVARALDTVPVSDAASMAMTAAAASVVSPSESSEVIPMQESLELRLDDSNAYNLPTPWSPVDGASIASTGGESSSGGKMDLATSDTFIVSSGGESSGGGSDSGCKSEASIVPFSSASQQVKLELEVTLAPEAEVSSTVVSQADSDTSSEGSGVTTKSQAALTPTSSSSSIVCLPLPMTTVQQQTSFSTVVPKMSLAIVTQAQPQQQQQQHPLTTAQAKVLTRESLTSGAKFPTTMILTTTSASGQQKEPPIVLTTVKQEAQQQQIPRTCSVGSSTTSSLPFLAFSTAQPLRSVSNVVNQVSAGRTKSLGSGSGNKGGGGRRSQSNKPPPGAVNLERSYQICQAVIQNSPNRHQLKHQLRPPPSMLAAAAAASSGSDNSNSSESGSSSGGSKKEDQTQHGAVTSTNRTIYKIQGNTLRGGLQKKTFGQRQASPLLVRQVFTASPNNSGNQGTSGNFISVIPSSGSVQSQQSQQQQQQQIVHADGQYVLVQRAGIDNCSMPRASSAPPAQNQQIHGVNGIPISNRGRPASVEVDSLPEQQMILVGPNPGVQAVTRRGPNQVYGDISMDPSLQNFGLAGEGTPPNCACSLNAMVICQQCGNFSHASCVGTSKLCVACDIR